ncbi:phosphodiester glycosidase family protein [Streptomyces sp. NPDC093094]|uniref:phosphodiester glycosidase family protein n=1 Tax=Streptomyces sp. NPDC093094 TaxID=3366026 RepID=UPI00380FB59D
MSNRTARRALVGGALAASLTAGTVAASVEAGPAVERTAAERTVAERAAAGASARLPLGPATLTETRTSRQVAAGVTHIAIERGRRWAGDFWTITVGVGTTEAEVARLEDKVRAAGYQPRREATAGPDPRGPRSRPLGWLVRVGRYTDESAAGRARTEMISRGLTAVVHHTDEDGHPTTGPWSVDVLVIDPARFRGRLRSELANGIVPGRETTSSTARRTGALAAVNGGFFVIPSGRTTPGPWLAGTDGDLAGISVVGGRLVSEAVGDRPALVVPSDSGRGTAVRRLRTRLSVRAMDGTTRQVTGLNRQAGLIVNCGGVGTATPFSRPAQEYTCGNANELIAFDQKFGTTAPEGTGRQATLDADGRVTAVQDSRGGPVPARGTVLQGTGTGAQWLRDHARVGAVLSVHRAVVDADTGEQLSLTSRTSVVNGAPLLLRDGLLALDPVRDGWSPEDIGDVDRAALYNAWYLRRAPRTAAGVTKDGRIVLLTVDGRRLGHSAGLTVPETAMVMRSLGAVDAVNLDGGGSTTMVVKNALQGTPSDRTGERPDGDALVLLPPAAG